MHQTKGRQVNGRNWWAAERFVRINLDHQLCTQNINDLQSSIVRRTTGQSPDHQQQQWSDLTFRSGEIRDDIRDNFWWTNYSSLIDYSTSLNIISDNNTWKHILWVGVLHITKTLKFCLLNEGTSFLLVSVTLCGLRVIMSSRDRQDAATVVVLSNNCFTKSATWANSIH